MRSEALVIGGVDYAESDRVVHLLTRDGRQSVFALGAKKSRRRFQGALEPFVTIEMELHRGRKRSGMLTLTSARVLRPRIGIRDSLDRIALASYVTELARRVAPEEDPIAALFELVSTVLDQLDGQPASLAMRRAFELRTMAAIGFRPTLNGCLNCGASRPDPAYLNLRGGGVFCGEHRDFAEPVGPKTLEWMQRILAQEQEHFDGNADLDPEWAERASRKLSGPMGTFFLSLIGNPLNSTKLLESL